jgi:hypothetical protein
LEWLLFTALEHDAEQRHTTAPLVSSPHGGGRPARQRFNSSYGVTVGDMPAAEQSALQQQQQQQQDGDALPGSPPRGGSGPRAQRRAGPLLLAAARLIAQFPQFSEIVVSVARKTDAALWPSLFAAVGSPAKMCQGLLRADKLQVGRECLVMVMGGEVFVEWAGMLATCSCYYPQSLVAGTIPARLSSFSSFSHAKF